MGYLIYWFVYWVKYRIRENEEAKTIIFFIFVSETVMHDYQTSKTSFCREHNEKEGLHTLDAYNLWIDENIMSINSVESSEKY